MGLIRAGLNAVGGTLASQWKEYFYLDAMPEGVLAAKANKKTKGRFGGSRNEDDNIISAGSVIAVNEGQCAMIVDQGKIVEFTAEPGEFVFDQNAEPSIFYGPFGTDKLKRILKLTFERFSFGGQAGKDQRVYFFNTKEITGNKYGTPSPIPFRVVDNNVGLDMDVRLRCFGVFSYRICDPVLFYKHVCGNISEPYTRSRLDEQLRSELLGALGMAFGRISEMGIRYSALQMHTMELADTLNDILSKKWRDKRGLEIVDIGISSVTPLDEDVAQVQQYQSATAFRTPQMAAQQLARSQDQSMRDAANNAGGAALGFMGMNMAQQTGGNAAAQFYQMAQQQQAAAPTPAAPAAPAGGWKCPSCGATDTGKFCPECGAKKPADEGWTCACGSVNKGKFCPECGAKKPAGVPQYRCDKCGWEPPKGMKPPKFCPECGDPFDDGDVV